MRRDRRGLRYHVEVLVPEDLMPPAGHRLRGRGHHAEQDIGNAVVGAACLGRAHQVERARAVVQQGGIGQPQRGSNRGVALVPSRADRVVAGIAASQPFRSLIDVPRCELGIEDCQAAGSSQIAARADRTGGYLATFHPGSFAVSAQEEKSCCLGQESWPAGSKSARSRASCYATIRCAIRLSAPCSSTYLPAMTTSKVAGTRSST